MHQKITRFALKLVLTMVVNLTFISSFAQIVEQTETIV
jgi:hypothetical protein